jgi:glycogen(starch) synthase
MKVIVVSNFYPPRFYGGYELGCEQVVNELRSRGHEVTVLTSKLVAANPRNQSNRSSNGNKEVGVLRNIKIRQDWSSKVLPLARSLLQEILNQRELKSAIRNQKPDVVYFWNLAQVGVSTIFLADSLGVPTCFFVSDHWMKGFGLSDPVYELVNYRGTWKRKIVKSWFAKVCLRLSGAVVPIGPPKPKLVQFCSEFLRAQADAPASGTQSEVVHWGVWSQGKKSQVHAWPVNRFLYTGRLTPEKGVRTAVEAFVLASRQGILHGAVFTLCGEASDPVFEQSLREIAQGSQNGCRVVFRGKLTRQEVLREYIDNDVFLFPSEWDEPFSIALLEALDAGLAVIGTKTGGTPEILQDSRNGLVYHQGDVQDMVAAIRRLLSDRDLCQSIRVQATEQIQQEFLFSNMVDKIEKRLLDIVGKSVANA